MTSTPTKIVHLITDDDPVSLPSPTKSNKTLHTIPPEEPQQCPTSSATATQIQQQPAPTLAPAFQERPDHRTHHIYTQCETITGQVGSDQTGRFVVPSTSRNNYIFVLYDYDSNSIHAEPIPNRKQESIKDAYEKVLRL